MEVKASDRTYIRDAKGTLRVADYKINGVENSELYQRNAEKKEETNA